VVADIARSSSYSQTLVGPVLVIPYTKQEHYWVLNAKKEKVAETRYVTGSLHFLPDTLRINAQLKTELRERGIYRARLYHADSRIEGAFNVPAQLGISENFADYEFSKPYVAVGISDIRGIENSLKLTVNDEVFDFSPGAEMSVLGNGVHATLAASSLAHAGKQPLELLFSFDLKLQGTEQLQFLPIGQDTHVRLSSDWPHPSFNGEFLPVERNIDAQGFTARWQTSYFSTNIAEYFTRCINTDNCNEFRQRLLGVKLIDPVDQYVKSDRAIKYALLFIGLTFASFFLFEVLKRLQIHPVQYALVGIALAFFYLLLLSLAEHLGFALAYLLSSAACVLLIGFYVSTVLQSIARAIGFSVALSLLYSLLYGLLSAEDYALLMGSLLLFVLLGVFMSLTRKVDWYSLGSTMAAVNKEPS
jgi:inner membrane protein